MQDLCDQVDCRQSFDMCRLFAYTDQHGIVLCILGCLHLLEQVGRIADHAMSIVLDLGGDALLGHVTPSNT